MPAIILQTPFISENCGDGTFRRFGACPVTPTAGSVFFTAADLARLQANIASDRTRFDIYTAGLDTAQSTAESFGIGTTAIGNIFLAGMVRCAVADPGDTNLASFQAFLPGFYIDYLNNFVTTALPNGAAGRDNARQYMSDLFYAYQVGRDYGILSGAQISTAEAHFSTLHDAWEAYYPVTPDFTTRVPGAALGPGGNGSTTIELSNGLPINDVYVGAIGTVRVLSGTGAGQTRSQIIDYDGATRILEILDNGSWALPFSPALDQTSVVELTSPAWTTFEQQDSDEFIWMLEWCSAIANDPAFSSTVTTQAQAQADRFFTSLGFYVDPETGAFARGSWGEAAFTYDGNTPLFVQRYWHTAPRLGVTLPAADYALDLVRFGIYSFMPDRRGRHAYGDLGTSDADDYLKIRTTAASSVTHAIRRFYDALFVAGNGGTAEANALKWISDEIDALTGAGYSEQFSQQFYQTLFRDLPNEGVAANPFNGAMPRHWSSGQFFYARENADVDSRAVVLSKVEPWRLDHVMWHVGAIEIFGADTSGTPTESIAITKNACEAIFVSSGVPPSNQLYIEQPSTARDGLIGVPQGNYGSSQRPGDRAVVLGSHGVDGDYAFEAVDLTLQYYDRGNGDTGYTLVKRALLALWGYEFVYERAVTTTAKDRRTIWRVAGAPSGVANGYDTWSHADSTCWYKELVDDRDGGFTTNFVAPGAGGYYPSDNARHHIEIDKPARTDSESLHLIAHGVGLAQPTDQAPTSEGSDTMSHLVQIGGIWHLVVFARGAAAITAQTEIDAGVSTTGLEVYAIGFDTGALWTVSNPSGNLVRLAPGSGTAAQSDRGTAGIIRSTL